MQKDMEKIRSCWSDEGTLWRWQVAEIISKVPSGHLATYGCIAEIAREQHGLSTRARNAAWVRRKLYELLGHDTEVPLHRVAKIGDVESLSDSKRTKIYNDRLRGEECSLDNSRWLTPEEYFEMLAT